MVTYLVTIDATHLSKPVQTKEAFLSFRDWQISFLTTGVAVAVNATIGT